VRTVIADGRNFLLTTSERYDVIISEPSNPWIGGLASLFSVEFFQTARQRLRPGGMMLQWVQGYSLMAEDLQMVVRTFRTVFPATTLWTSLPGDFLLLGRAAPAPIDLDMIRARYDANEGLRRDMARIDIKAWPQVFGYLTLGERDAAQFAGRGGLNTDDRLPLEFSAPRALYVDTTQTNWKLVQSFMTAGLPNVTPDSHHALELPEVQYWIGQGYLKTEAWDAALAHFERALQLDPAHTLSTIGAGQASLGLGRPKIALELAQKALAREPENAEALRLVGRSKGILDTLKR
jgi:spermidine synthase